MKQALQCKPYRFDVVVWMILVMASALAFVPAFAATAGTKQTLPRGLWIPFVAASTTGMLAGVAAALLGRLSGRWKFTLATTAVLIAAGTGAWLVWATGLPESLLVRVRSINLQDYGAWSRIRWTLDALRIFWDHPLVGTGGGGWSLLYFQYQSYGYFSTQVHNHLLQVLVETGIIGMAAFLTVWILVGIAGWRAIRLAPRPEDSALAAAALSGVLALGLHSVIDFNLSLSAVSIALWVLFGVLASSGTPVGSGMALTRQQRRAPLRFPSWIALGVAVLTFGGTLSLLVGFRAGQRGVEAMRDADIPRAVLAFERATRFDPFTASHFADLGQAYWRLALSTGELTLLREADLAFRRALNLEPNNVVLHEAYGRYLLSTGRWQDGISEYERARKLQPFELSRYEALAQAYVRLGLEQLRLRSGDRGQELAERALGLRELLEAQAAQVPPPVPDYMALKQSSPSLALAWGQANALLGRWRAAEQELLAATKSSQTKLQVEAFKWLVVVRERRKDQQGAQTALAAALKLDPESETAVRDLRQLIAPVLTARE